jgi:molybdopterin converting factor small subunit
MKVRVKVFGPQAVLAGTREVEVSLPTQSATAGEVLAAVAAALPPLRPSMATSRLAVNHTYAAPDHRIDAGDEVALIGMVSGG